MEDQYFSSIHSNGLFDLNLSGCAPMGFSPSIEDTNTLPFTIGDGLETPSFMFEVQRKRADTVTTLKPDFELKQTIEVDMPKRKRAAQRLSLASSIASSAPSTSASDGFDSENDGSASPSQEWNASEQQSYGQFAAAMQSTDRVPDLVHWRSNMTMQVAYHQVEGQSPSSSCNAQGSEFSFADFIDDNAQSAAQDDSAIQETVDSAQAMSLRAEAQRPSLSWTDSSGSLSSATSSSENSDVTPSSSVAAADDKDAIDFHNGLGLFGAEQDMDTVQLSNIPDFEQYGPQDGFISPHSPVGSSMMSANPSTMSNESAWSLDAAMSMHPAAYRTHAMMFTQSAPPAQMAMYAPGMNGSPVPSSPAFSARSSSPFPAAINGVFCSSPLMRSPASHHHQLQHLQDPSQGSPLPKGMNLLGQFAHLANPYAGLITKRSRGRRVPSKPEEMNNLGKSGKVYTCKVPGCGKCFKRSEHLKRHVRSIHTDEKPYLCPFPNCHKRFSRHDNLNQHARVHATASSHSMHVGMSQVGQHGMAPMPLSQLSFGDVGMMMHEGMFQRGEGDDEEQTMASASVKAELFAMASSSD